MATAAVQLPSHNRIEPGSSQLQAATYPGTHPVDTVDAKAVAPQWVEDLNRALSSQDYDSFKHLFLEGSCWRDQLGLSWDYHTLHGPEKMAAFLKSGSSSSRIKSLHIDDSNSIRQPNVSPMDFNGKLHGVTSFLTVETDVGRGRGLVRLMQDPKDGGKWKAFTLFTAMLELKGHEETVNGKRPHGVEHGGQPGRKNWQERRHAVENFEDGNEPTVLILGT